MILVIRPSGDIINMTAPYHTSFSHASSCRCRLDSVDRLLLYHVVHIVHISFILSLSYIQAGLLSTRDERRHHSLTPSKEQRASSDFQPLLGLKLSVSTAYPKRKLLSPQQLVPLVCGTVWRI
jgi:hypothetical protein